jgi:hypothetical protein
MTWDALKQEATSHGAAACCLWADRRVTPSQAHLKLMGFVGEETAKSPRDCDTIYCIAYTGTSKVIAVEYHGIVLSAMN